MSKEREQLFSILHKNTSKIYSSAGCKLSGQNSFFSQAFCVQVNPHKDVVFKVSTGEVESLSTTKRFNKMSTSKMNEKNPKQMQV